MAQRSNLRGALLGIVIATLLCVLTALVMHYAQPHGTPWAPGPLSHRMHPGSSLSSGQIY